MAPAAEAGKGESWSMADSPEGPWGIFAVGAGGVPQWCLVVAVTVGSLPEGDSPSYIKFSQAGFPSADTEGGRYWWPTGTQKKAKSHTKTISKLTFLIQWFVPKAILGWNALAL